ncbi:MAG: hypothetical protein IKO22_06715 [Oscillospiraceae bacterium]|nr:hypothetical protein [Oscillospiraceae bacterium]
MEKALPLRERIHRRELVCGTWINTLHDPRLVRMIAACGFDFVSLDMEHSAVSLETLSLECMTARLCGLHPLVRSSEPLNFKKNGLLMDLGAGGLIVPDVESAEMAEQSVRSIRFLGGGTRGYAAQDIRSGFRGFRAEDMRSADREAVAVIQIESREGVAHVDEILSVEGVDVVVVGRGDLAKDMGLPCEQNHPRVAEAVERVCEAAARHGVCAGLMCPDAEKAREMIQKGARFLHYSNEQALLTERYRNFTDGMRTRP